MRILIIAYDFPPCHSSGVQRTLKFAENLTELGWDVRVLTADENSYELVDNSQIVSENLNGKIYRAKCINLKKTMSYKGKYFSIVEKFEKIWPWYFTGKKLGQLIINKYRPDVIFSTYPAFTAHCIGYFLAKKFNIPWVMDYRDPLRQHYDLSYENLNSILLSLENKFIQKCEKVIFTSNSSKELYSNIHPNQIHKFETIRNGYDSFIEDKSDKEFYLILHSGVLYSRDRNIDEIIYAVYDFIKKFPDYRRKIKIRFRGAKQSEEQNKLIINLNLEQNFEFLNQISYSQSLEEISHANILLVIQNGVLTRQIPGKIFDYISANKNIICYTSQDSALHEILLDNIEFCYDREGFLRCLILFSNGEQRKNDENLITQYSRINCSRILQKIFFEIVKSQN